MHFLFDILIFTYLLSSQIRIDFAYIIVIQLLSRNINGNEKFSPEERPGIGLFGILVFFVAANTSTSSKVFCFEQLHCLPVHFVSSFFSQYCRRLIYACFL